MHYHREEEALVPWPRGNLPMVCAVALSAITVGGIFFVSPESFFGWVAMVILLLTLGPLLHGLCLLAEEMLYHSNTRYRGKGLLSHVLPACGLGGKPLLAAALAGLLLYLIGHPLPDKWQCWQLLFMASVFYALLKSLGVMGPSEVEMSDICEGRKMNVAHGLAWSFYLGYLHLVLPSLYPLIGQFGMGNLQANQQLHRWTESARSASLQQLQPESRGRHAHSHQNNHTAHTHNTQGGRKNTQDLEDSIAAFCANHQSCRFRGRGSRKLLILIPVSANISHKLEDEDDNIHFYDNLPNTEIDRAGVRGRVYKHSVYRVMDEHGKTYECVVEYATPLLTLHRMSHESSAGFGEPERRQQVLLFYRTLKDILEHSLECRNHYRLILLNDEHDDDPHFLSKAILRHLQQQEKEEFCLTPPPHQEATPGSYNLRATPENWVNLHPEPISEEPTLMISSEGPQSLRMPVEISDYPGIK